MRLAVTGGRAYSDRARVEETLNRIHAATPLDVLIHGDASGADSLARDWAIRNGVRHDPYPAAWDDIDAIPCRVKWRGRKPYNALAGLNRNTRMILQGCPHLVVVFSGNTGTQHMRGQALRHGVPILDVEP